jgi:hypothetical protein
MADSFAGLVFISYRRRDTGTAARWLAESLALAFGPERVFIDTDSIRIGDDWPKRIDQALEIASVLVVLIGTQWLRLQDEFGRRRLDNPSDWVRREIAHALSRGKRIIQSLWKELHSRLVKVFLRTFSC